MQHEPSIDSSDEDLLKGVSCFGRYWDPDDHSCAHVCTITDRCIQYIANVALPAAAKKSKKDISKLTAPDLEKHELVLSPKAMDQLQELIAQREPTTGTPPPDPGIAVATIRRAETERLLRVIGAEEPAPIEEEMEERPSIDQAVPEEKFEAKELETDDPPRIINRSKKGSRKKRRPQKENPPRARAEKEHPTRAAQSAPSDEDGHPVRRRKRKRAKQWGPHTFAKRWTKERAQNPMVGRIPVGWILRRVWKGHLHEVVCREGSWEYEGQKYPTLYAVVEAITGVIEYPAQVRNGVRPTGTRRMTAWSARRFFSLDRILKVLDKPPETKRPKR